MYSAFVNSAPLARSFDGELDIEREDELKRKMLKANSQELKLCRGEM